jgi:hypothetical protein
MKNKARRNPPMKRFRCLSYALAPALFVIPALMAAPAVAAENWQTAAPVYRALVDFNNDVARSCGNNGLRAAIEHARRIEKEFSTVEDRAFGAGVLMDIADAAAVRGCPEVARELYDGVLAAYAPGDFDAVRLRAETALAALP